jgi:hypothetical protein
VGLFEIHNISGVNMVEHVKLFLGSFGLLDKVITYVKDEGNNLVFFTIIFILVVSYSTLKMVSPFIILPSYRYFG